MSLFYNETTKTWYDPRAPMVGKYAPRRAKPAARPFFHTRYIGNVHADAAAREALRRAASKVVARR